MHSLTLESHPGSRVSPSWRGPDKPLIVYPVPAWAWVGEARRMSDSDQSLGTAFQTAKERGVRFWFSKPARTRNATPPALRISWVHTTTHPIVPGTPTLSKDPWPTPSLCSTRSPVV